MSQTLPPSPCSRPIPMIMSICLRAPAVTSRATPLSSFSISRESRSRLWTLSRVWAQTAVCLCAPRLCLSLRSQSACVDCRRALTVVAGPGGGSDEKPVGLVWFGLAMEEDNAKIIFAERKIFGGDRAAVRAAATLHALGMMLDQLAAESSRR